MTDNALIIRSVDKFRGKTQVLKAIDLAVAPGERVALLGHNGAGKSTLIKMILGQTSIDGGDISIGGAKPGRTVARAKTAFLPESVNFHPTLTGHEQLTLFASLSVRDLPDIDALLDRVGLAEASNNRIATYSKGMRQRLGLAQVLLGQPTVALLDEPTSGLDPISRQDLYAIIDELAAQGTAVLIASHALTEVEAQTDRIAILRKGIKVADDTLDNLSRGAGLPTRMRILVQDGQADQIAMATGGTRINGASVELYCDAGQKMQELRRIAAMGDVVADIELTPPRLEDLYRHYSTGGQT
ncbi:MAG: ABC transporter ATP-binding protein [Rhodobacteraceae bacterium]|nr:ABC transporter ATP-binding protein [Paracoccaceae bacterium]